LVLGFPEFYGRNMNAWVDCMTCLDDPGSGMSKVHAAKGSVLTLLLGHAKELRSRCPELFQAIEECAAFVNWRRIEQGHSAVMALAYYD
jgi:hypothetical protein